jgi:hypothetical protein
MYTGGNKSEQIEQLKELVNHMEKVTSNPPDCPSLLNGEIRVSAQRARLKYLKRKRRQLGRLERKTKLP